MGTPQPKPINFENPVFKALLARNIDVRRDHLKYFVLPAEGDKITLGNIIYEIKYTRENPFRFSAEPVAILQDEELEKLSQEPAQNAQDSESK